MPVPVQNPSITKRKNATDKRKKKTPRPITPTGGGQVGVSSGMGGGTL